MFLIRMHNTLRCVTDMVGVAQLARATGCGPVGRGFESLYPPQFLLRVDIGSLAQLVEQGTLNPKVEGSSPSPATKEVKLKNLVSFLF